MDKFCIYRHIKPNGEVFYIGIGNLKRPYEKRHRNNFWLKTIKKYPDYEIEILKENISFEEAIELETILISYYGRRCNNEGSLCNITLGGEGLNGFNHSEESKKSMSIKRKGIVSWNKNIPHTELHKKRLKINSGMAKKVICTETGKIWNSGADCAKDNNINYVTFMQNINGTHNNKTKFKFLKHGE